MAGDCLNSVPLFKSLSSEQLETIRKIVVDQHFAAGEMVFNMGDKANSLLIIAQGKARVFQSTENGREKTLYILSTGDFDGEAALFAPQIRHSFAEALTSLSVCSIRRSDFQKLLQAVPSIGLNILNVFGKRLANMEQQTTIVTTQTVEGRLLDYLRQQSQKQKSLTIKLPLKKKDLATLLGTTPETLSRKFKKMSDNGILKQSPGKIVELNSEYKNSI